MFTQAEHVLWEPRQQVRSLVMSDQFVASAQAGHPRDCPNTWHKMSAAFVLLCLVACSGAPPANTDVSLRVDQESELSDDFGTVAGAETLASGAVVVADNGHSQLRLIRSGAVAQTLGRPGRGPGEFTNLYRVHVCADSIVAYDFNESRLHIFTERAYVRTIQLPPKLIGADFAGCAGMDSLVFVQMPEQLPGLGLNTFPLTVLQYHPQLREVEWVTTLRGTDMYVSKKYAAFYERPFGLRSLVAAGAGGIVVVETQQPIIQRILANQRRMSVKLPGAVPRTVSNADRRLYLEERLADEPDTAARRNIRGVLGEADWGTTVPVMDRLLMARTGDVFVRLSPMPADSLATWALFRYGSPIINRIRIRRDYRVLALDSVSLVAVKEDADGADRVVMLRYH